MIKTGKASRAIFMLLILLMTVLIGNENVFAATTVSNFQELKDALAGTETEIVVEGTITATETLVINKDVKISGGGITASDLITNDPKSGNIFYVEDGKKFELDNITLDGASKARLIYSDGGTLKITNSTLKNGCPGSNAKANPGGGIFLRGGSLEANNTNFIGNTPGTTQGLAEGDRDLNGAAIYSGIIKADITITGGKFEDNEVKAYGHGAAIYQENGTLNVTGTKFKGNSGFLDGKNPGTQGACIHTRDKVTATISGVNAEIAKGFNTGGFLRAWGSDVTVTNSTFTIKDLGDGYGYSGGALCFENGKSEIKGSTFTCTGSKLIHAGGFIDIVGGGTHVIDNNTMTGDGVENFQFKAIASFGGAISVEEGASATVTIKDNTIKDTSASDTGGAIVIGTHKGVATPATVTMSGNTITNPGTYYFGGQYGGGVFVGPDATVTMSKDTITNAKSSYGGGVYNEGKLTISGGSSLTGGVGSKLGGEIYNNGDLTVDDATITGSYVGGAAWQQYASHGKNYELGGTNIYAEKDVTITPKANITTGKDVRVLDGQSKILLTGPLTKEIDVSISETSGGSETQNRRVGYVVAEGTNGYAATKSDAKNLHYIGRTNKEDAKHYSNQPRAAFEDDKSTGEWDFVLDKDNKKVVLGQRVKLIYHGNLGKFGTKDSEEKTVDVYKNPKFWEGQLEEYKVADPTLDGSSFMGWYFWKDGDTAGDEEGSIQNIKIPNDLKDNLFDFSKVTFQNNVENTDQIITPNIIHTYAGWSDNISIPVLKEWIDAKDDEKVNITVTLKGGEKDITLTLTKAENYFGQFEDLKVFTKSYENNEEKNMNLRFEPKTYSVKETPIDGFTTSYSPQSMVANQVAEVSRFVVTNTKVKTGSVYVKYVDEKGTEIAEKTELKKDAPIGEDYSTTPKTIKGYKEEKWKEDSAPVTGKVKEGEQTVIYVYKKIEEKPKTGSVYVKYVDEKGKEIAEKTELKKDAPVGEDYSATPKTIKGYEEGKWKEDSAPVNGKVKEGEQTVIYVYKKIEEKPKTGNVYVKYIAEDGTVLEAESAVKTNAPVGEAYTTEQKIFDNYEFSKMADDSAAANGKIVEGDLHVVYVYKAKDKPNPPTTITTDYVDEQGTKLIPSKDGAQPKEDIPGYEYLKTEKTQDKVTHIYKKTPEPTPQPPIIPEKPEFNPFWPIYFGSNEKHVVSEKTALNKEDHKAYMFGYPNWNFLPNSNMTRAEVTAMFARLLKNYPSTDVKYNLPYSDVFESDWYYPAVGFMTENNIIKGYEDGTFRPNAPITRAEFATIASKFEELVGNGVNGFKDVPATHWALKYINSAYARGWVTGYEDGTFRPDRYITRAEVVTVTNKMLIRYVDVDFVRANKDIMLHFKDLDESHWAYFNIMEATHGHDFTRKANMLDEIWHRLNGDAFIFPDLKYNDR